MSAPMKSKNMIKKIDQQKVSADEKKKLLEAKIRKQVECEERAFRIVERLIENPISEEFLIDACQFIEPHHYEDIVEERSITKTCGYPVCSKCLTNIPRQKYHISTKDNKVYDITERKNFCSNQCYKASKHLQEQISTSPLWIREGENHRVSLLTSSKGLAGFEVVGPVENVRKEVQQLKKLDSFESKSKAASQEKVKDNSEDDEPIDKDRLHDIQLKGQETSQDVQNVKESGSNIEPRVTERPLNINKEISDVSEKLSNINLKGDNVSKQNKTLQSSGDSDDDEDDDNGDVLDTETRDRATENKPCKLKEKEANESKTSTVFSDEDSRKGDNSVANSESEDKIRHLMKLLDKRKHLVGQLAEIDTVSKTTDSVNQKIESNISHSQKSADSKCTSVPPKAEKNEMLRELDDKESLDGFHSWLKEDSQCKLKDDSSNGEENKTETDKFNAKGNVAKSKPTNVKNDMQFVIQVICQSMKSWITPETVKFLQTTSDQDQTSFNQSRADFEAMYQALCRRVDAGEFEIEDIGTESTMEDDVILPKPLPQYDKLKEDTNEFASKVQQFYAGKLFSDPVEKDEKEKAPVYLPTIDSHNQMQIRQKIVMERLQKVISDVLSPLKLTIQDVFTEYKEIIRTFRLDSKNILYKPGEWTLVNLILIRMLSRKNRRIRMAFLKHSSVSYFKILLGKLGTNLQQIDLFIDQMLHAAIK